MPFRSVKQRKFLWANHPDIAKRWTEEHGSTPQKAAHGKLVSADYYGSYISGTLAGVPVSNPSLRNYYKKDLKGVI